MATIFEALAIALEHHQAGQLETAEQIYRQVLQAEPNHADAIHLLGVIAHQVGKHEIAIEYIERAIQLKGTEAGFHANLGMAYYAMHRIPEAVACYQRALELQPDRAETHFYLGNALQIQGSVEEAEKCFRRALYLKPDYAEAYNNLGIVSYAQRKLAEAVSCYRKALELKPEDGEVCCNLGNALKEQGKLDEAIACYHRSLELQPDLAEAHLNLGIAFQSHGKLAEAVACYQRVLELKPGSAEAYLNLGLLLHDQQKLNEAVACFHRALEMRPDFAEACYNLGNVLRDQRKWDEAIASYRRALEIKPDLVDTYGNLGNALKDQGELEEAVACYRRALELKPDHALVHSNLVYTLSFLPGYDAKMLYDACLQWNRQHAEPLAGLIHAHANDRNPDRRLKIGYVSPNFREHPVGQFIEPLLAAHDRGQFEIFCYASVQVPDKITDRCRAHVDTWRNVLNDSDEKVADVIREDRIDILVDLTMHMANNRLLVFARKPAPVQVTYLAYCGTTGLRTMDYRLTDPYLDPSEHDDEFYSEQSIRLPETYWCYRPTEQAPAVNALPAMQGGPFTFGSLNNFCKVTTPTLALWGQILRAIPQSRLLLHAHPGSHRDRLVALFAQQDVSPERLMFAEMAPTAEYFRLYQQIDLALDPFPYGGGTTTCDALWMGVPVVSLAGQTAVGRGGLSILSNVGLPELVASDPEQYVKIAIELADDLPRLSELRATLRERMQSSPLMDLPRFACDVEAAYRRMWHRWCGGERKEEAR